MKTLGIIAEYDPFHNGHLYHLKESLSRTGAEASVCVMSGEFTQRGLPAVADKRVRANIAVACGADLAIELPFVYAVGGAELFARGAVRMLAELGVVDFLSFGSESGDIAELSRVADVLAADSAELNSAVRAALSDGLSYPAARERAVAGILGPGAAALLREPNNILGIEYLKELRRLPAGRGGGVAEAEHRAPIEPVTIRRDGHEVGATAIRAMLRAGDIGGAMRLLPDRSARMLAEHYAQCGPPVFADAMFPYLIHSVITAPGGALADIHSASEGLENRLVRAVRRAADMDEAVRFTKTRRYTETRVRRLILHTILGLTKERMAAALTEPLYARVLAFSEKGAGLIRRSRTSGGIPLITNPNRQKALLTESPQTFSFALKAAEFYRLLRKGNLAGFNELTAR